LICRGFSWAAVPPPSRNTSLRVRLLFVAVISSQAIRQFLRTKYPAGFKKAHIKEDHAGLVPACCMSQSVLATAYAISRDLP